MIPIRLGTVAILQMMVATGLVDTLVALIIVYVAQGLPLAIFILSEFMLAVSDDLKDAGRIDGLSEYRIFFMLVLPVVRPAMATVAVFIMIPIWNDLWFPLILAPGEATKTVTLGDANVSRRVSNRLEWRALGVVAGDRACAASISCLLPPTRSRHHCRRGEVKTRPVESPEGEMGLGACYCNAC